MAGFDQSPNLSQLPETARPPEYSVEHEEITVALKNLVTNRSAWGLGKPERPYSAEGVKISVVIIDPKDADAVSKLRYSQTYLEPDHPQKNFLENIVGQPLRTITDLITIKDRHGQVMERLYPLILEEVQDEFGNLVLAPGDGNHRLDEGLNSPDQQPFCTVIVSNIPRKNLPNYWPVKLDEVEKKPMPLDINERRRLKPGFDAFSYKLDRPNFTRLGSGETVNPISEAVVSTSSHQLIERQIVPPEAVSQAIKIKFADKLAPLPLDAALEIRDDTPSISGIQAVHSVTSRLKVVEFSTQSPDGSDCTKFLTARNQAEYLAHATRATALVTAQEAEKINQNHDPSVVLLDEFRVNQKSDLLTQFGISGSSNPNAPAVVNAEIKKIPGCSFSFLVMELEDGQSVSLKFNPTEKQENTLSYVRNILGRVTYSYIHCSSVGLKLLEVPRYDQLPTDFQELLNSGSYDNSPHRTFYRFGSSHLTNITFHELHDHMPLIGDGIQDVTDADHRFTAIYPRTETVTVAKGRFYDSLTAAAAIVGQLISKNVVSDPQDDRAVLLQRSWDPLRGEVLIIPKLPHKYHDKSQPKFSEPDESLNVEYTNTLSKDTILKHVENVIAVPVHKVIEMIEQCQFDVDTIAHLGSILMRQGVLRYHKNYQYQDAKDMYLTLGLGRSRYRQ